MNQKLWLSELKGQEYKILIKWSNEYLSQYSRWMKNLVNALKTHEEQRSQLVTDALNKMILFETSVEMNNKYDTKQFAALMDELHQMSDTLMTEMTGESETSDNPYEVKKKMTGDHLWSTIIDSNFLTYML